MLRGTVILFTLCLVLALSAALSAQEFFHVPVRINMGGPETEDSYGRTWLGDRDACGAPQNSDPLGIRPDDNGGGRAECDWFIGNFQPDSLDELGFDSFEPGDVALFNSIRWDEGNNPPDFLLEIPIPNGDYHVNMYFAENCCPDRHFKIEVQEELLAEDVSYLSYSDNPALGRAGVLSFEDIVVDDGILRIGLLPCPECPGATDTNAIIDALEILALDLPAVFHRADPNDDGTSNITDAVYILDHLFGSGPAPTCQESADANDDGAVNISDPVAILGFLFGGDAEPIPPAAPGPPSSPCGPDPAGSTNLGCDTYNSC